jgi:hypothetical protein
VLPETGFKLIMGEVGLSTTDKNRVASLLRGEATVTVGTTGFPVVGSFRDPIWVGDSPTIIK